MVGIKAAKDLKQSTLAVKQKRAREVVVIAPSGDMMPVNKIPHAAYVRVSSDSEDQLNSFSTQLKHYNDLIRQNEKWVLIDVYADEGITGTSMKKRDDFNRMITDCEKGKIKRILTKSISRFCRNTLDCLTTVRKLRNLGVSVYFEKEGIDTNIMTDEMILTAMSDFAQHESISTSNNLRTANRMRMSQGTYKIGHIPYGYVSTEEGELEPHPEESEVVKRIYKQFLCGEGFERISKSLNEEGIIPPSGKQRWHTSAIRYILLNERYTGDAVLQKSYTTESLPFRKRPNQGEYTKYIVEDFNVPILDKATFDRVQATIEQRRAEAGKAKRDSGFPLSRFIVCGHCGCKFKRKITSGKAYWSCRTHDRNRKYCPAPIIPEPEIESACQRLYNKLKMHRASILGSMVEQLYELKRTLILKNPQALEINERLAELANQMHMISGLHSKGAMPQALFYSKQSEIDAEMLRLRNDKKVLIDTYHEDALINRTKLLIDVLESGPDQILAVDYTVLEKLVSAIIVKHRDSLIFKLHNEIELTEVIGDAV